MCGRLCGAALTALPDLGPTAAFRHEALLYAGIDEFVELVGEFVRDGARLGEPTLVVVSAEKRAALLPALGDAGGGVRIEDMDRVGRNPGRIISTWCDFVDTHRGSPMLRGVGEPIHAKRGTSELDECVRHEALLNNAFDGGRPWWLVCPYDTSTLPSSVIDEALRTHPLVGDRDGHRPSGGYRAADATELLGGVLPVPPDDARVMTFGPDDTAEVRRVAWELADAVGLAAGRAADLVLVVSEIATNSIVYGGGGGVLSAWSEDGTAVFEVRDRGVIVDPLVGRTAPPPGATGGRGLWLVHQMCDLVEVRSTVDGTIVRIRIAA